MTALTKATAASGWSRTLQVVEQNFVTPLHIGVGGPHFRVVHPLFGHARRLPAQIFPWTDCATAFSSVSLHVSVGGPHFRVVRHSFGQLVASRLKYFRIRIVRRPFRTFLAIPDDTGAVAHVLTVSAFRARLGSAGTCCGAREEVREIGAGTDVRV